MIFYVCLLYCIRCLEQWCYCSKRREGCDLGWVLSWGFTNKYVTYKRVGHVGDGATADVLHGTLRWFDTQFVDKERIAVCIETMYRLTETLPCVRINALIKLVTTSLNCIHVSLPA